MESDGVSIPIFALHSAAADGKYEVLKGLCERLMQVAGPSRTLTVEQQKYVAKDKTGLTPLHHAIINGHVSCARLLATCSRLLKLSAAPGATLSGIPARCNGCPSLHLATCTGAYHSCKATALKLVKLLLENGAEPMQKDDCGRLALHWAAESGQEELFKMLLKATMKDVKLSILLEIQDDDGDNVLNIAARWNRSHILSVLLDIATHSTVAACISSNKQTLTPLAAAAYHGAAAACQLLVKVCPESLAHRNKHGYTPAELAARRGHQELAEWLVAGRFDTVPPRASTESTQPRTLVIAPAECLLHKTCANPRFGHPHVAVENLERLQVLVDPDRGVLATSVFDGQLDFVREVPPVQLADVLQVHEWNYVKQLNDLCLKLSPDELYRLDHDTVISQQSLTAALQAASAVCLAIDKVVLQVVPPIRNAFCAVRPPGHHAGPLGSVPTKQDRVGSHGFCLLNNVAIGAAYAMNVLRHVGIKRVAILDFDVHHGHGTRACVSNTFPSTLPVPFSTPLSRGTHVYETYKPWLGMKDKDNVLFASVQGYGPKHTSTSDLVYPSSGATYDSKHSQAAATAEPAGSAGIAAAVGPPGQTNNLVVEDPNCEFTSTAADDSVLNGPRVIDVGISGPGPHAPQWQRAWRDKILPAVVNFKPDLVMISAGFDAHKKDGMNYGYISITEADYAWLTDQIVQVANRCCNGRIVSVLEGGYDIAGGIVSAFARSVAAHVSALAEPHSQEWDADDAKKERFLETQERAELAAQEATAAVASLESGRACCSGGMEDITATATPAASRPLKRRNEADS